VKYKAHAKINQKKKRHIYDKWELYYQDVELKAGIIVMNFRNE
jgi:hypothetical protein